MAYLPISVLINALGDEATAFTKITEITAAIVSDKTILANTLNTKGVMATPTESLLTLINKVVPLQVNFDLHLTETFTNLPDNITDVVVAAVFPETVETAVESFTNLPTVITETGDIWVTEKWNAVLTGDNTPAQFIASASTEEAGFEAYKAFDNTNATANDAWLTSTGNVTGFLQYQDTLATAIVTEYKLTSRNVSSGGQEAPKTWTLEGSNDGSSWTVLDTRSNIVFSNAETKLFYFINTSSYSYYKLNVTQNGGSANFVAVGELELRKSPNGTIAF